MRQNRWNDKEAQARVDAAGTDPADRTLALRVYSSRIIGADPDLVMHGGGNTSVKTERRDLFGAMQKVLHVKGSGWDLDTLEAPGLPGVRLEPLLEMRRLDALSDEDMVNMQRSNLLDSSAPNPSVETLLHAFLPHTFVDHTHATAFLALANLPDAEAAIREIFGDRLAVVPYIMPGFALAKKAAEVFDAYPGCEGLILLKHGHFTFGASAKESYDKVIEHTNMVEEWLAAKNEGRRFDCTVKRNRSLAGEAEAISVLPVLRGAIASLRGEHHDAAPRPVVMDIRGGEAINAFLRRDDLNDLAQRGVASPDHVIRTKAWPLILEQPPQLKGDETIGSCQALEKWLHSTERALQDYTNSYQDYFDRQNSRVGSHKQRLDPLPRLIAIPGVGLVGMGRSIADANVTADIGEAWASTLLAAESIGCFTPVNEANTFDMEYWSLEQAKLGKGKEAPLARHVVVVTGGGGGIGAAIANAFAKQGAEIIVLDRDGEAAIKTARSCGVRAIGLPCDLTDRVQVEQAFATTAARFGGLDIVVSNAGAAWTGAMATIPESELRASFELNLFAHQHVAQVAVGLFRAQDHRSSEPEQHLGGQLLFNVSKQALNPGKGFGAYGIAKAALLALMKQYALEEGAASIRSNAINADRIRSGLLDNAMIQERSAARGVSEADYMGGNLLGAEVRTSDVANAFVSLALMQRTTGAVLTVDGGNVAAMVR